LQVLFPVKPIDPDLPLTVIVAVPALLDPGELMLGCLDLSVCVG
jgi:hypothetical protein